MGKKKKKEPEPQVQQPVFAPVPIESKTAETVILMLRSPEEEVLVTALEAIRNFAEIGAENKSSLVALGAVEPLVCLITHMDKTVYRNALITLGIMVSDNNVTQLLTKLNIIPSIITKLAPQEDVVVHEFVTLLLAHLSVDIMCKVQIFNEGGLELLIGLLSSPDPDVQKNSVECIYNLVQEFSSKVAVHKMNGLTPLLELLSSEFPIIQQLALRTLESISTDRETSAAFRNEQGFAHLFKFLANKEFSDLHAEALKVISNCLGDAESMQLIQENEGLEMLLQLILTSASEDIQADAVKAISRAAQSSENRKILHEQNIEKAITDLLAVQNNSIQTAACQAVSAMSNDQSSRDSFRESDGIPPIVQLLNSEENEVKEAAAEALSSLINRNPLNAHAVYEAEGPKFLVQLLQNSPSPAAVLNTTVLLSNMASEEVIRRSFIFHGAMQALLKALHSTDKHMLISTIQAIAALACDAKGRTELRNVGGLPKLVNLLKSKDPEIRRNTCWLVSVCANDEPTVTEMYKLGVLEILQEINCSLNRKNKFSEFAFQKLLNSNLSIKYSLTGQLLSTDIITDGFYDPGQTRDGNRVPLLEDIAKQAINQRRAVISVNGNHPDEMITDPADKEHRTVPSPTGTHTSSVMGRKTKRTSRKSKSKGYNEDDKHHGEDWYKPQLEAVVEKSWALPCDTQLYDLVKETFDSVLPLNEEVQMYTALAKLVCDAMGGPVDIEKQHEFFWELHLSELKVEMKSNIIPIGKIKKGTYYHRALLFKVLADSTGLCCSLVRGHYNRAWNEILLSSGTRGPTGLYPTLHTCIIDLMHNPGTLLECGTPAAIQYQTI